MANITIALDDELLRKARLQAVEEGTSVNAIVRRYLEDYVGTRKRQKAAVRRLLDMAGKSRASSGGRAWKREDLYDRVNRWPK